MEGLMKDGANQEIEAGKFCLFTEQNTARMSLGLVLGRTKKTVRVLTSFSRQTNKTPERIVQISDEVARNMHPNFYEKCKEEQL